MRDYLRIARAYLCRTTATVWCVLFLGLVAVSAIDAEVARHQAGIPGGGDFSIKLSTVMFAYLNACLLGILLTDNIAHPWASVLPHYRQKHLLITLLIALFFLALPMFSMQYVGTSGIAPTSMAVIFLSCLAAGLWTLHNLLAFFAFPILVLAIVRFSSSPELAAFLAGKTPAVSAALACLSLIALGALARRLLALNEDMVEYGTARWWGDSFRGRGFQEQGQTFAEYLATLPADQRARLQIVDLSKSRFSNLKQVDDLSGCSERSLWQRLQLWRLGTRSTRVSASVGVQILVMLIVIPPFVLLPPWVGTQLPARNTVVIFSVMVMTNPFNVWFFWIMRLHRLGYESLRPRTRQEFVRELGLALLWDNIQCWFGGVLLMGISAAIWTPEMLQVKNLILFIFCTGVGQLCAYAMYALLGSRLSKQGMVANVSCAFCPFLAMVIWILCIAMNDRIGFEINLAIASLLAAASVATIALAYRRWCLAELD